MKIIKLIPLLLITAMLFGCGKVSEIIGEDLAAQLMENASFSERLEEIDTESAAKRYFLASTDYSSITAYTGTAATCDEFVVVKTADTETVVAKLNDYRESKRKEYEKYRPQETKKLDTAIVEVYEDAVVMIITNDTDIAREAYNEYLKK